MFNFENLCKEGELCKMGLFQLTVWLKSIRMYSKNNKVFLIGTRCESEAVQKVGLKKADDLLEEVVSDFESELTFIHNFNSESEEYKYAFPVANSLGKKNEKYLIPLKNKMAQVRNWFYL